MKKSITVMKKYFTFLFLFYVINFANAQTQIQNARVKTRGRMVDGQYIPGKGLPGTVVSIKDITDIGVRNSDGTFSFPVDNNNYFVETVTKNEYVFLSGLKNLEYTSFNPSISNLSGVHTGDT